MSPVVTIPRISCHSHTHSHAPYSTRGRPAESSTSKSDLEHHYKLQLAYKLNTSRLTKLRQGYSFPINYVQRTHAGTIYHAYALEEELPIPNFPTGLATIKFSGHAPNDKSPYLTWSIDLKSTSQHRGLRTPAEASIAKVQVSLDVKKSFYWDALVYDPSTILRALAISLEIGKPLSIELYDRDTIIYVSCGKERKSYLVIKDSP